MSVRWIKTIDSFSGAPDAASQGFTGLQLPLGSVEALTPGDLKRQKRLLEDLGLAIEVFSAPLPQEVAVTQRGFNIYVWTEYAKRVLRTGAELGFRLLVWSDGRARVLPLEGDTSGAKQQVLEFLAMLCDLTAEYGITLAVEPLGPRRTNYLNRMQDIVELKQVVGRENLFAMISLRELTEIGLGDLELGAHAQLIRHVHLENPLADPGTRQAPRPTDQYDYRSFLSALHAIGYDQAIALPGDADSETLRYCEGLWPELS